MSSPSHTPEATLAQRLKRTSPEAYAAVGPIARYLRRAARLARGSVETMVARRRLLQAQLEAPQHKPLLVVDGCAFQEPQGGIARLWRSLLHEWAASGFLRHVLVIDRGSTAPQEVGFSYVSAPPVREPHSHSQRLLIERICSQSGASAFISTGYTRPLQTASVQMIYDMTPEVLGWNLRLPRWREKRDAIEFASSYVCISQSTLSDLHRFYPSTASRPATVAYCGVGPAFRPAEPGAVAELKERLSLPERYWLFVGRREGYKNAALLFDALRHREAPAGVGVLLVGGSNELEPELSSTPSRFQVRHAHLNDDDLRAAYSGAAALVYPSRYEGFGLPVAEAMACGCPVITCRNSSLPEVGGSAALYVDESDPRELLAALRHVLEPGVRERLAEAGLRQAARFEWTAFALAVQRALANQSVEGQP